MSTQSEKQFCALCGANDIEFFSRKDAKSRGQLSLMFCNSCGLVQQSKAQSSNDIVAYYSDHYRLEYKGTKSPKTKHIVRAATVAQDRLKLLVSVFKTRRQSNMAPVLLDVGAGGGEFVYSAQSLGFKASGIEPNIGYSEFARAQYGIEIRTQALEDLPPDHYDCITLFHVLEHLPDPLNAIKTLYSALKHDGILMIEVPNLEQKDASPSNIFFKAHLFYFSQPTLMAALHPYFDPIVVSEKGNLRCILRKREIPIEFVIPTRETVVSARKKLNSNRWLEYTFVGGGAAKPVYKLIRLVIEMRDKNRSPREIIDKIIHQSHDT